MKIALVGLGYVGLPLAVEFGKQYQTIGFDICQARVAELCLGIDSTLEVENEELAQAALLKFTANAADISDCEIFIVTVPTPIDKHNRPDLSTLKNLAQQ